MKKNSTIVLYGMLLFAFAATWALSGIDGALMCIGLFHIFMWLNVTATTLSNALVGRTVSENDAWYRVVCILIGCVCIAFAM